MRQLRSTTLAVVTFALSAPQFRHGAVRADQPEKKGLQEFQPGLSIDWQNKLVEVSAKVVLRAGTLELLMCSARTKEHESILVSKPRPLHIMQALGLVGLEPGKTPRYDFEKERTIVATGEPLDLRIRYRDGDLVYTVPTEYWLTEVKSGRSPDNLPWVFSGSKSLSDGRFAADVDGTVASVVDFETSLISVGALHSADDGALWLEANTEAIPPLSTDCTLIVRSAKSPRKPLHVSIQADGTPRLGDIPINAEQIAGRLKEKPEGAEPPILEINVDPATDSTKIQSFVKALVEGGVDSRQIEVRPEKKIKLPRKPSDSQEP